MDTYCMPYLTFLFIKNVFPAYVDSKNIFGSKADSRYRCFEM